jgi:DNA-binding NarL/FixJ family response regulator
LLREAFRAHHLVRKEAALPIRVLIVDDVPALRELFRLALAEPRFQVVGEAGDGVEAVQIARETRPDVILLDVSMPRMDGLQAIPLLHEASPGTRILMLSAFNDATMAARAISRCATAYLEKGVPSAEIISTVVWVYESPPKKVCATQS